MLKRLLKEESKSTKLRMVSNNGINYTLEYSKYFTSQPRRSLKPCSSLDRPPTTTTVRMPNGVPNLLVSSSICWANSRVGANIIAYGP